MRFAPYPNYKKSGEQLLGEVPKHWTVMALKRIMSAKSGDMIGSDEETPKGIPIYGGNGIRGFTDKSNAKGPIILIGRVGALCGNVHLVEGELWASEHAYRVFLRQEVDLGFLRYLLSHLDLNKFAIRTAQPLLNTTIVETQKGSFPTPTEQQKIVAFLDRETGKVDRLIGKQEKLIALLQEKRQAVITHAVTNGLNPNAPMKDSGIDWLGDVPAHWEPYRVRHHFRKVKRQNYPELTVLSVYRDYGVIIKSSRTDNINKTPEDLTSYQLVEPGDLVVNKMKAWQGSLGISEHEGITSPDYVVFEPVGKHNPFYLHHYLRTQQMPSVYRSISNGIRPDQWRLEPDKFINLPLFLPSLEEQQKIFKKISSQLESIDATVSAAEKAIERMKEHRSALISAAVTGKIDVRGLVPEREAAE